MNPQILLGMAVRDCRQAFAKALPESRSCEWCEKTAWWMADRTVDSYLETCFMCASGHLRLEQRRVTEQER